MPKGRHFCRPLGIDTVPGYGIARPTGIAQSFK